MAQRSVLPPLKLLGAARSTWWDQSTHRTNGVVTLYLAEGKKSGQWLVSVKVNDDLSKALVKVVGSELTTFKHSQFWGDRKNHNFLPAKGGRLFIISWESEK